MAAPVTSQDLHPSKPAPRAIRNLLALSVGGLILSGAVMTVGGFAFQRATLDGVNQQLERAGSLADLQEQLRTALLQQEIVAVGAATDDADGALEAFEEAVEREFVIYLELARVAPDEAGVQEGLNSVRRAATAWREEWAEPILRGEEASDAVAIVESRRLFAPVNVAIEDLAARIRELRDSSGIAFTDLVNSLEGVILPAVIGISVVIGLVGVWLIRSISGPLHRLNLTAQRLVDGEEVVFHAEHDDEIGALAMVLERMRLESAARYETALTEAEIAATFNQLGEMTSFAQDEATLVDAAVRVLQRVAPSPRGQVMLLNNSTNRLMVAAAWGEGLPPVGSPAAVDRTDRCPGIRRATAYVAEDLGDELSVRCQAHPAESGTVVCLPMPALGSIVGVIHLERSETRSFDGLTVQRAARIAEQVALALANARLMKTMEGLANTDPLTGLRNARFFDAYLEQQFTLADRDSDSIAVVMLDVDHFKQFNDTYGHPAGDEALRALSRTMRGVIRASDVVARYGGEEFIIALHHATLKEATMVAEKIREAVEHTVVEIGPGRYGRITVSLGVAATDAHHADRKGLVSLADAALYRAKHGGRNRVEAAPSATPAADAHAASAENGAEPVVLPVKRAPRASMRRRPTKPAAADTA
jgi:diguanylate cyclase (GGDEF)-like protein